MTETEGGGRGGGAGSGGWRGGVRCRVGVELNQKQYIMIGLTYGTGHHLVIL